MPDMALNIDHPHEAASEALLDRQQQLKPQVLRSLRKVVEYFEALFLGETERLALKGAGLSRERLQQVLFWADELAEGRKPIPEEIDENDVVTKVGQLEQVMRVLLSIAERVPLSEQDYEKYAYPSFYSRIVGMVNTVANRTLIDDLNRQELPLTLRGIGTAAAMRQREDWLRLGADPALILRSLAGVDTPEAMHMRKRLRDQEVTARADELAGNQSAIEKYGMALFESVAGVDTAEAMEFRKEVLASGIRDKFEFAVSLQGLSSDLAMAEREQLVERRLHFFPSPFMPEKVVKGLRGVHTDRAMELRRKLRDKVIDGRLMMESVTGVDSPEAMEWRRDYLREAEVVVEEASERRKAVLLSLVGVGSDDAMNLRQELRQKGAPIELILQSLAGVDTSAAWVIRDECEQMGGVLRSDQLESIKGVTSARARESRKLWVNDILAFSSLTGVWKKTAETLVGDYSNEAFDLRQRIYKSSPLVFGGSLFVKDALEHLQLLRHATEKAMEEV